jgi:cytochrome c-type biogenesis protein CcmH
MLALPFVAALPTLAQDEAAVTDDDVNTIASRLYCPVCENIPLDTCDTAACIDWREDIRTLLTAGMTEEEIVDDFVNRYGERVIGTPRDPFLRGLSLYTPLALLGIALVVAGMSLRRWWGRRAQLVATPIAAAQHPNGSLGVSEDDYRSRLEEDLKSIR